jgi:predicted amidophosphoribosyltransferase
LPLYCFRCDETYISRRKRVCPECGSKLYSYRNVNAIPIGARCKDCTLIGTGACSTNWELSKLKTIFRADHKRQRETYDSYRVFLNDECQPSRSLTANELYNEMAKPQASLIGVAA